jgi:hypothetical protein
MTDNPDNRPELAELAMLPLLTGVKLEQLLAEVPAWRKAIVKGDEPKA